jgi:hypothetical protein
VVTVVVNRREIAGNPAFRPGFTFGSLEADGG